MVSDVKSNRKGFCKYTGKKRKISKNVVPVLNCGRDMVTKRVEMVKSATAFCPFGHKLKYRRLWLNIGKHFFTMRVVKH